MKKMKFERKLARAGRGITQQVEHSMEPPGFPAKFTQKAEVEKVESPKDTHPAPLKFTPRPKASEHDQLTTTTKKMDWGRVRAAAHKAAAAGMPDEKISDAIDAALPDADTAGDLPIHHLLAVVSAASDKKRPAYKEVLKFHAGHAKGLPPAERAAVFEHLKQIGHQEES